MRYEEGSGRFSFMTKTFSDMYRDPRWQKKRLEVLSAANWTCSQCGDVDQQLHVHHYWYTRDEPPWVVVDGQLAALCHECHATAEEIKSGFAQLFSMVNVDVLHGFMCALHCSFGRNSVKATMSAMQELLRSPEEFDRLVIKNKARYAKSCELPFSTEIASETTAGGAMKQKIGSWFGRRPTTQWSTKEMKALLAILKHTTPEDIALMESYYTAQIHAAKDIRRRDVQTLLNNWTGEMDRARAFAGKRANKPNDPNVF